MFDYKIQDVCIVDGSGRSSYKGTIGIKEGRIYHITNDEPSNNIIDGNGLILCPGFIDGHSHGDFALREDFGRYSKVSQGITTEIAGQCGMTWFPVSKDPHKAAILADITGALYHTLPQDFERFTSLSKFVDAMGPTVNNYKLLVGHAALRIDAMGMDHRDPTEKELCQMTALLGQAMNEGAMGMSSGLLYSPSGYAEKHELVQLLRIIAPYNGLYATHMRNEGNYVVESVEESLETAHQAGVHLDISHHKICGQQNWGKSKQTLKLLTQAEESGQKVFLDVYPYTSSLSNLDVCLPAYFFAQSRESINSKLHIPAIREQLEKEIRIMDGRYVHCGGFSGITVAGAPNTPQCEGKTIEQYALETGKRPFDAFFDILLANGKNATAIYSSMCEEDLCRIIKYKNAVIGTDGMVRAFDEPTHPRGFGSFPRMLAYFVKRIHLLPLEEMIHKMTGLPAQFYQLPNKGYIRDGYDADLVLINYENIEDKADIFNPTTPAEGIEMVFVNGQIVYKNKALTGITPGHFIPHGSPK